MSRRLVVKLGTSVLTGGGKRLSRRHLLEIVRQAAVLREGGAEVVLVSSGAVAAGREALDAPAIPRGLPAKQMLAAVGQVRLMQAWSELFALFEIAVGQVLLTRVEIATRAGYLNARDTLQALLAQGVVPIVNENDTLATDEIRVGDNDNLSALVANLVDADLLVLLSDIDGLYSADPRRDPNATRIAEVPVLDESVFARAGGSSSGLGTGGMVTKLQAARLAGQSGIPTVLAAGAERDILLRLASGETVGTRFLASTTRRESRQRWLLSERPAGVVVVDAGAAARLRKGRASLLPVGVIGAEGAFERGAVVQIRGPEGSPVAVGIAAYGADEVRRLAGARSAQMAQRLGEEGLAGDEIVHRDNLVPLP